MITILASSLIALSMGQTAQSASSVQPSNPPQVRGKLATDRDRLVLQALLLNIVADAEFPPKAKPDKAHIVLHRRTPKTVEPIIDVFQVNFETGGRVMPKDAWDDLERRNVVRLDPNARLISYEGLQFEQPIQVGNAFPGPESTFVGKTFEEIFPHARGWLEAYVPGYSKDGKTAVVKGRVGPVEKKAMLTAILRNQAGVWSVSWRRFCVYN